MSDRLDRFRNAAASALERLQGAVDEGHAVALSPDEAAEVLGLLKALDSALPSVGPASDLELKCSACKGRGCDDCEGIGTVPTAAGRKVWEFVARRLTPSEG